MKKAIIVTIVIVVIAAIAGGAFFYLNRPTGVTTPPVQNSAGILPVAGGATSTGSQASAIPGIPAGATLSLGDTTVSPADLSAGPPADAPQGSTIPFQTASGTVTLDNFYTGAQGYWSALDAVLIQYNSTYSIWYYRDSSDFVIEIPLNGSSADADVAAAVLATDLGVSQQALCGLPVSVLYVIDRGMDSEQYPLDFCSAPAL